MLSVFNNVLLLIVILLGLVTSYEDFRFRKIKNKWLLIALGLGGISLLAGLTVGDLSGEHILKIIVNASVSLVLGYIFWYFDLWAAGDAKLFFILALFLPLKFYWRSYLPIFPSFVILINTFAMLLAFLSLRSIFLIIKNVFLFFGQGSIRTRLEDRGKQIFQKIKISYLNYLWAIIGFGLAFIFFQLIRLEVSKSISNLAWVQGGLFFLMIFLGVLVNRVAKNKKVVLIAVAILVFYIMIKQLFYSPNLALNIFRMTQGSIPYLVGLGFLSWLLNFHEKATQDKNLHFALWLFFGAVLTILINGSLFLLL